MENLKTRIGPLQGGSQKGSSGSVAGLLCCNLLAAVAESENLLVHCVQTPLQSDQHGEKGESDVFFHILGRGVYSQAVQLEADYC